MKSIEPLSKENATAVAHGLAQQPCRNFDPKYPMDMAAQNADTRPAMAYFHVVASGKISRGAPSIGVADSLPPTAPSFGNGLECHCGGVVETHWTEWGDKFKCLGTGKTSTPNRLLLILALQMHRRSRQSTFTYTVTGPCNIANVIVGASTGCELLDKKKLLEFDGTFKNIEDFVAMRGEMPIVWPWPASETSSKGKAERRIQKFNLYRTGAVVWPGVFSPWQLARMPRLFMEYWSEFRAFAPSAVRYTGVATVNENQNSKRSHSRARRKTAVVFGEKPMQIRKTAARKRRVA